MKLRNFLTILFAVLAIIGLLALAAYMTVYVSDDSNPVRQQVMKVLSPGGQEDAGTVSAPENTSEQTEPVVSVKAHSFLFVGDSRTVGMGDAVNDSCEYLGAEGQGYDWFSSEGQEALAAELKADPQRAVIFNFGVNDPENVSLYIDLYQALIRQYPNTSFYIMSVNPLIDSEDFNTTNEMISLFNATVKSAFPDRFLDTCSYLTTDGFETVDGLHYTDATYQKIHDFVVSQIA